ncbi:MAG TPA: SCO family protein [Gaiellaceae bacterium]|nr:SCO family protein [Gaiellaceae bacterium]
MRPTLACLAAATVLVSAGCGGGAPKAVQTEPTPSPYRGMTVVGSTRAPEFALRDQSGRLVRMSDRQGRYTLLTFLYTNCPDVCPLIASHLNTALGRLDNTRVLAVSVDPKGDTPTAVRRFVAVHRLRPEFRYLTGTAAQLKPVWAAYHVASDPQHGTTAIAHTAFVLLVDPQGQERLVYDSYVKPGDIVHDIEALKEK